MSTSMMPYSDRDMEIQSKILDRSLHRVTDEGNMHEAKSNSKPDQNDPSNLFSAFPDGGRDAWLAVLSGFLTFFCGMGFLVSFSVFQSYYRTYTLASHSDDEISWIGSLAMCMAFFMGLPAGKLSDKYGPKVPTGISTILIVLGTMTASVSTKLSHFILSQGLCSGIGYGMSFTPALSIPPQYFLQKRGLSVAYVVGGSGIGGVIWPIAVNRMLNYDNVSLGWTLRTIGFIQLALMTVATFTIKNRLPRNMMKEPPPLSKFFHDRRVLALLFSTFVVFLALYVPFFYISPFGIFRGASVEAAYYYPSILNAGAFVGRFVIGILADRVLGFFNALTIFTFVTSIVAFGWLGVHNNAGTIVFAALYGFFSGSLQSLLSPCIAALAPSPLMIGTWVGVAVTMISIAILGSQPIAGRLLENTGRNSFVDMQVYCAVMLLSASLFYVPTRLLVSRELRA